MLLTDLYNIQSTIVNYDNGDPFKHMLENFVLNDNTNMKELIDSYIIDLNKFKMQLKDFFCISNCTTIEEILKVLLSLHA